MIYRKLGLLLVFAIFPSYGSSETMPLVDYVWHDPLYPPESSSPQVINGYFDTPEKACKAFEQRLTGWGLPVVQLPMEMEQEPYRPNLLCRAVATAPPASGNYSQIFYAKFIPYTVKIEGPSSTSALPSLSGPVRQRISITRNDGTGVQTQFYLQYNNHSAPGTSLTETLQTDENGVYEFLYVPPYFKGISFDFNVRCNKCENMDYKSIVVAPVELSPQMCARE
ncbi:hypothetical protein [Delftia lacustris]|uniref:Uncharacterized protein n=1 Tax=Delftia lacustris TaxID=558537 RepID=A0A1H3NMI8_9BURK|nr:hypothetical protein [Delftia lacustris]SDY90122.1 hypothetical protein SAMN05421547_10949 [Delftia lacustris]